MILSELEATMSEHSIRPEDLAAKTGLSINTILNARRGKSVSIGTASLIDMTVKKMKGKREDSV